MENKMEATTLVGGRPFRVRQAQDFERINVMQSAC